MNGRRLSSAPASDRSLPGTRAEHGMNTIETMLVLLTLSILSAMIINSIRRFTSAHAYSEGQARVREVGDRVIWQVSEDAALAAHVFTSNSFANEYLAKCDLGVQPFHPKPPGCSELGYFERDVPGAATTGNYLFVAKAGDPVLADLSGDRSQLASVQTYRFVVYIPVHGPNQTVDLARWVSVKIARLNDIERVTDPVKRTLLGQALYDEGVSIAWEPGRPIATGLRVINPSGSLSAFTPGTRVPGEPDQVRPAMFTPSRMALAQNGTLSSIPVPAFAIAGGGFPGGFEVKVDGNASGRMILVRLVVTSRLFDGNRSALVFTRTMSNRGTM